jgi:hypothetical protein
VIFLQQESIYDQPARGDRAGLEPLTSPLFQELETALEVHIGTAGHEAVLPRSLEGDIPVRHVDGELPLFEALGVIHFVGFLLVAGAPFVAAVAGRSRVSNVIVYFPAPPLLICPKILAQIFAIVERDTISSIKISPFPLKTNWPLVHEELPGDFALRVFAVGFGFVATAIKNPPQSPCPSGRRDARDQRCS